MASEINVSVELARPGQQQQQQPPSSLSSTSSGSHNQPQQGRFMTIADERVRINQGPQQQQHAQSLGVNRTRFREFQDRDSNDARFDSSEDEEKQKEHRRNERSLDATNNVVFGGSSALHSTSSHSSSFSAQQPPQHQQQQQQVRTKRSSSLESSSSTSRSLQHRVGGSLKVSPERIGVVIAGWPNELAIQCAKACVKRGYRMLPIGICMNDSDDDRVDITDVGTIVLYRYGDSELRGRLLEQLSLAEDKLDLFPVVIDTSLHVENIRLYQHIKVPFVFETRADDLEQHQRAVRETEQMRCYALIAQRMDKHVAAVDSLLDEMARRFPGLFAETSTSRSRSSSFDFSIKTSEGNDKVNRRVLDAMSDLLNKDVTLSQVQHIASNEERERHGMARDVSTKESHIKRTYELRNMSSSAVFTFEQNVNAVYECAEGVADSVSFLAQRVQDTARPRVYDINDVGQQNRFLTW
jgi:hypothetical protein